MSALIRPAQIDDAEVISGLFAQLGYEIDSELIAEKYRRLIDRPDDHILVAEVQQQVVAVIGLHLIPMLHRDNDLARITALVVDEAFRGKGIGRQLVAEITRIARKANCGRIEVTSGDHRPKAHQFYLNLGYQCDERRFIHRF